MMNRWKLLVLPALVAVALGVGCSADLRELDGEYSVAKKLCEKAKECGSSVDVEACADNKKDDIRYTSTSPFGGGSEEKPSGEALHDCATEIAAASCGTSVVSLQACATAGIAINETVGAGGGNSDAGTDTGTEDTGRFDSGACSPTGDRCGDAGILFRCPSGSALPSCKFVELIGSTRLYCCESP